MDDKYRILTVKYLIKKMRCSVRSEGLQSYDLCRFHTTSGSLNVI
jgi:hypothetical protein